MNEQYSGYEVFDCGAKSMDAVTLHKKLCWGFGAGNFKALFEAVENGQRARGNLSPKKGYL
uniref:Uncharacterized protein n=1 Tax=Romanomermis culicivorax TaxID=13658 RepID=A0A915I3A4_ROMCU